MPALKKFTKLAYAGFMSKRVQIVKCDTLQMHYVICSVFLFQEEGDER